MSDIYIPISEVAKIMHLNKKTVYGLINAGIFPTTLVLLPKQVRVLRPSFEDWARKERLI